MCKKTCYGPQFVTPDGVPNMNPSSYSRHKIRTALTTTCDCSIEWRPSVQAITCTLAPVTLANPSHNSRNARVHLPSRATTQGMSFRATTQGMPQQVHLEGTIQRLVDHAHPIDTHILLHYCLALL